MRNPRNWLFASDVDGTWTTKKQTALVQVVDDYALPPEANAEMIALRARFTTPASAGRLTPEQEMEWLQRTLDMYVTHRLTRQAWQAALDNVVLREGVVETYAWCVSVGLRTCAVSYGCADFVEYIAMRHGLQIDAVYAGRLIHDGDLVVGYIEETLTIPEQKGERSRHFADLHGVPHERLIGAGDTGGDRHIGHLKEHRIGIAETDEAAEKLRALDIMGEVHVTNSFHPVLDSIKRRIGLP
jgi:phosphoserine phosphatase